MQTAYILTWAAGSSIACVIAFPAVRPGDIIGLLGLGSVAISFAFQDIFKNFLAGILMLLHEPFQLGDQIVVEGFEGTVEEISMRSTQILTDQGERVIAPNAIVFTNSVRVLTARPHRRTDLPLILDYNTEPSLAIESLVKAISEVEGVLSQPTPEVDLSSLNDGSLTSDCPLLDAAGTSTGATDQNQGYGGDQISVRSSGH